MSFRVVRSCASALEALAAVVVLAACSFGGQNTGSPAPYLQRAATGRVSRSQPARYLYVGNRASVTVYEIGSSKLVRKITDGVNDPTALAVDHKGYLYVGNSGNNSVTIYKPNTDAPFMRVTRFIDQPVAFVIDEFDNFYVLNHGSSEVTTYHDLEDSCSGCYFSWMDASVKQPTAMAQHLGSTVFAVVNHDNNRIPTFYGPATHARIEDLNKWQIEIRNPRSAAYDAHNLYVACQDSDMVLIINLAQASKERPLEIRTGISRPSAVAIRDPANHATEIVAVANRGNSTITMYHRHSTILQETITSGLNDPVSMAFDQSGKPQLLYVANLAGNSVTVYAPLGKTTPEMTITQGINRPFGVAFSP